MLSFLQNSKNSFKKVFKPTWLLSLMMLQSTVDGKCKNVDDLAFKSPVYHDIMFEGAPVIHHLKDTGWRVVNPNGWRDFFVNTGDEDKCNPEGEEGKCSLLGLSLTSSGAVKMTGVNEDIINLNSAAAFWPSNIY